MTTQRTYQYHLSLGDTILKDREGRGQKFRKILSVLKDFRSETHSLTCLDLGCSHGIITSFLGDHFSEVIGMDIDQGALQSTRVHGSSPSVQFLMGDAMIIPLREGSMDVVICNHIYEHVPDAKQMMEEIYRVLKKGGFCYFAAGNKYMVMEGHYHLPLLSWFPKPLAHLYLKWSGKGNFYYEDHLSLRELRKLVQRFEIHDYTLSIIRDPRKFFATELFDPERFFYRCIRRVSPYLYWCIPTYVWILTKK